MIGKKAIWIAASLLALTTTVQAAGYPDKPISLVIGFPPGGGADNVARVYADHLAKTLKQPVIVENRPGAGSTIAAAHVARAKPDGYTIFMGNSSVMGSDNVLYKVAYTPDSFIPVGRLTTSPMILIASKKSGIGSVQDLLEKSQKEPGKLTFASSGNGVITHLAGVEFLRLSGRNLLHVPFKGGAPATQSVAAGDTDISFATAPSAKAMIDTGKVKGLAITSKTPSSVISQYKPIDQSGLKGYDITNWWGIFVPAGTPRSVIDTLFAATGKVLAEPAVKKNLTANFEEVNPSASQKEFVQFARTEGKLGLDLARESLQTKN
jgi:tripartite-type tricarboxylate transporter receptor subunit TctC